MIEEILSPASVGNAGDSRELFRASGDRLLSASFALGDAECYILISSKSICEIKMQLRSRGHHQTVVKMRRSTNQDVCSRRAPRRIDECRRHTHVPQIKGG